MSRVQHPAQHERQAARRYLEHDYASEHLAGQAREQANRHAQAIDEEHPRARDIALTGTARELGELPAHLRRHQLEARKRAGITAEKAEQIRHEYRRPPVEQPDDEPPRRSSGDRAREAARTAGERAGSLTTAVAGAAADSSWGSLIMEMLLGWGSLIMEMLLGGAGLSIFYLFLTRARAASELVTGTTNVVRAVISPAVDPLNPKGALR